MFSGIEYEGDKGYIAEDLFASDRELESHCHAVEKSVKEGYFSIGEALSIYQVTEPQYLAYLLLRNNHLNSVDKQQQLIESLNLIFQIYHPAKSGFDKRGIKIINELQTLAH